MNITKRLIGLCVTILCIIGITVAWANRNELYDWWRLRGYEPPTVVIQLADKTTMTPAGRKLFYVNRPVVADKAEFNDKCSIEASIVLGCYIPARGIYLYNISDQRLQGVMEVTAAHEMLHAAYERLSSSEKERINTLTAQAYAQHAPERVRRNVESYQRQDPSVVPNELHSILASEVRTLPAELEEYYKKYFSNRLVVVALAEQYEAEFENRKTQVETYDKQLAELKIEIEANQNELNIQYKRLESEKLRLEKMLSEGDVQSYNTEVPSFNNQIKDYNDGVREANQRINQFEDIRQKRNDLAIEVQNLVEAIDSRPQSF